MTDISSDSIVERNCEIVRRILVEIWTEGNIDLADELIAEDAVDHDRQPGEENGLASFKLHVGYLRNAATDLVANIDQIWGAGDKVVARWRWQGTHDGSMFGIPPTYKSFDMTQLIIYRLEDSKVVEVWKASDLLQMLEQIEILPPRGTSPPGFLAHFVKSTVTIAYRQIRGAPKTAS
ncbi:MAG: ester cyclase [Egibacteraceae bacterium]